MSRLRRNFDREFRDGAVRIVKETGRPVARIARGWPRLRQCALPRCHRSTMSARSMRP